MSEVKVNKISPRTNCGTVQLGDSGDTITIPAGVTITNNGTQTGFGRTGTVDWDTTAKTASFTAVSGNGYFVNTTSGAITVTLPAGSAGDIISLADYAATWQTNNVTVTPNGTDKIGSLNENATLNTEGQSVTFVYVDSTQGWINTMDSTSNVRGNPPYIVATGGTITTCGNCKIHTFTGPGTFTVNSAAICATNNLVSYLVVAGGGASGMGAGASGAGGGAGGYREVKSPVTPYTASPLDGYPSSPNRVTVTASTYPITVGSGGADGSSGSNSIFSTITSAGGGLGASQVPGPRAAISGGSGGGGDGENNTSGATGNTPPVSPPQGNSGGNGVATAGQRAAGGGGGAGAAGTNGATPQIAGPGGDGVTTSISGSPTAYAGGGGGQKQSSPYESSSTGGSGGGGNATTCGTAGTANTGGGAGASAINCNGAAGGSGIVIIRYKYQ